MVPRFVDVGGWAQSWDKVRCGISVISGRWISNCRTGYPGHGRRRFLPGSFPPSWHPNQLGRKACVLPSPSREGPQNHGTLWLRADSVGEVAGGPFRRHTSSSDPTACQLVDVLVWARVVLVLTGTAVTSCGSTDKQKVVGAKMAVGHTETVTLGSCLTAGRWVHSRGWGSTTPVMVPTAAPPWATALASSTSSPMASCHGWGVVSTSSVIVAEELGFEGGHTCFHGPHRLGASWGTARWGTVVSSPWQHRWQGHPARGWWRDGWGGWDAAIHLGECNVGQAWLDSPKCR